MNPYDDNAYAHVCECSQMQLEIRSLRQRLDAERTLTQKFQAEAAALRSELHATRKNSQPAAETLSVENQQALLDEERAPQEVTSETEFPGLGSAAPEDSEVADPVSNVVSVPLVTVVQRRIEEIAQLAAEEQRYEVALKMLCRARSTLESATDERGRPTKREHKEQLAWKLIKAAMNVLDGGESEVAV